MKKLNSENCRVVYFIVSSALLAFILECVLYCLAFSMQIRAFWFLLPLVLYILFKGITRFVHSKRLMNVPLEYIVGISSILLFSYVKCSPIRHYVNGLIDCFSFATILNFLISLKVFDGQVKKINPSMTNEGKDHRDLFNIFYLNTSKAHEIAMLIDNKIMKTVEREQTSEEVLRRNNTISLKGGEKASAEFEYIEEDNTKRRVFESFDVKTTKSIMLRKIYDTVKSKNGSDVGALMIFENVELSQLNYDDTAMLMSILQDSKLRNQGNDSIEVNLSKMMERILDDFTIDYTFGYDEKNYVIQLPYKAKENFENGYHHNDIQLGKLSIIGINRGEIDFTRKGSVSSRFFELVTSSMGYEGKPLDELGVMKFSNRERNKKKNAPFDFSPERLTGKHHLIDVIAIIQEINFDMKEENS